RAQGGQVKRYDGETCVLAYSGGLDTSVAVAWLRETLGFEVVTCTGDLGATGDLEAVQRKAIASGAKKAIVQDARDIFVRYFVWPALQAGALYEDRYPLATALGRPLLAKLLVDAARAEGARFVAHGCTGKGNDQVRFDLAVGALAPDLTVIGRLNELAGKHGVGRIDQIENRLVGIKSREIYEAPAAVVLHQAHRALEDLVLTKDALRFKARVAQEYADLVYNGLWFSAHHQ